MFYSYAKRLYGQPEIDNVTEVLQEGHLTDGVWCQKFEQLLSEFIGCKHVILCNSGSSANLLAVSACQQLQLDKSRRKVITPAVCFPTTVAPVVQLGYYPFYIDVDLTGNADPYAVIRNVDESTAGIIITHTLGNPADVAAIVDHVREQGDPIWIIEDCCDALGAKWLGQHVGRRGDCGTLSFYPAHHITTAEGGAVFTDNDELARTLRSLRDWGRACNCTSGHDNRCGHRFATKHNDMPENYDHKYTYNYFGYNLKMSDLHAAIGCAQMDRLPDIIKHRRRTHWELSTAVRQHQSVALLQNYPQGEPAPFALCMLSPHRGKICQELEAEGIQTRPLFAGDIRKQIKHVYGFDGLMPNTKLFLNEAFFIGVRPDDTDVSCVADILSSVLGHYN